MKPARGPRSAATEAFASCNTHCSLPPMMHQIVSSVVGESERRLSALFAAARAAAPCILFFDQIEALAPPRGDFLALHPTT